MIYRVVTECCEYLDDFDGEYYISICDLESSDDWKNYVLKSYSQYLKTSRVSNIEHITSVSINNGMEITHYIRVIPIIED